MLENNVRRNYLGLAGFVVSLLGVLVLYLSPIAGAIYAYVDSTLHPEPDGFQFRSFGLLLFVVIVCSLISAALSLVGLLLSSLGLLIPPKHFAVAGTILGSCGILQLLVVVVRMLQFTYG